MPAAGAYLLGLSKEAPTPRVPILMGPEWRPSPVQTTTGVGAELARPRARRLVLPWRLSKVRTAWGGLREARAFPIAQGVVE